MKIVKKNESVPRETLRARTTDEQNFGYLVSSFVNRACIIYYSCFSPILQRLFYDF